MAPVADASSESLHAFVLNNAEPGATVITDAWQGYRGLEKKGNWSGRSRAEVIWRDGRQGSVKPRAPWQSGAPGRW